MFDGFKLRVTDQSTIESILHHQSLQFKSEVAISTGEQGPTDKAKYRGLLFEHVKSSPQPIIYIRGCLPVYYTGLNNCVNLSWEESYNALFTLVSEFHLRPSTEVIKLEYGLNLDLPKEITVDRFINNILVYKGKKPAEYTYEHGGSMIKFGLHEFNIKIYNKSAQHQLHTNVMRYELATNRKSYLNRHGIYTMGDLLKKATADALQKSLLDATRHFVFFDDEIKASKFTRPQLECFMQFNRAQAWQKLQSSNPELYRKKRKAFALQVTKASGIDWNQTFYEGVDRESFKLLQSV